MSDKFDRDDREMILEIGRAVDILCGLSGEAVENLGKALEKYSEKIRRPFYDED